MEPFSTTDVLTVRQLKSIIKNWPELNALGEDTEVWLMVADGTSSPVKELWPLNKYKDSADILLSSG